MKTKPEKISFAYPSRPDTLVLQECSLSLPAGKTTFIVGKSGSGKSTVGNLLMRFYRTRSGTVTIDGNRIQDMDTSWLRNNITFIQQHSTLFNETIYTNVALGSRNHEQVTNSQVSECLEFAALQNTISELPDGHQTRVGSGGSALSGGQKQRIAIARARLRDTPILILDEATSALDNLSRASVMEALRQWRRGRTTIVITHDLASIHKDDMVLVMDAGRIVQQGYRGTLVDLGRGPASKDYPTGPGQFSPGCVRPQKDSDQMMPFKPPGRQSPLLGTSRGVTSDADVLRYSPSALPGGNMGDRLKKGLSARAGAALQALKRQSLSRAKAMYSIRPTRPLADLIPENLIQTPSDPGKIALSTIEPLAAADDKPLPVPPLGIDLSNIAADVGTERTRPPSAAATEALRTPMRTILLSVWPTIDRQDRIKLSLGFLAALVHAGSPPAFSYAIIQIFGTFSMTAGYRRTTLLYSMVVLGIAAADGLACFAMHYLLESASRVWVDRLRNDAIRRILRQPKSWFDDDRNRPALLLASLDRNAEEVKIILDSFAAQIFVVAVMMNTAVLWSFIACWNMTLVSLAASPLLYAAIKSFQMISLHWEARSNNASDEVSDVLLETFSDISTTRSLTLESYFHKKYSRAMQGAFSVGIRRAILGGIFFGISDSGVTFFTSMIFWYGAYLAKREEWSVKSILTVFSLLLFCTASATAVVTSIPQTSAATNAAGRLLQLARMPVISHEDVGQTKLNRDDPTALSGPIHFINQTFSYPSRPEVAALRRLNLTISSGKCTAIVGASGSGKSTIAALILGLYPPSADEFNIADMSPSLTLSGRDIRTLDLAALRSLVALVPQGPVLLPATVRENIIYGLEPGLKLTSASAIEASARAAGIHEFIQSLPQWICNYHRRWRFGNFGRTSTAHCHRKSVDSRSKDTHS